MGMFGRGKNETDSVEDIEPAVFTEPTRFERYVAHLDTLTGGGVESSLHVSKNPTDPTSLGVTAIAYPGYPEPGLLTVFTYGLSMKAHPAWREAKPELCLMIGSQDLAWAEAVAFVAEFYGGNCPFEYANVLGYKGRIAGDTSMSAFLVFAPVVLPEQQYTGIDVGGPLPVNLVGLYPIYENEREFIENKGLAEFLRHDWNPLDPKRPSSV